MAARKHVGPVTVEVEPAREATDSRPSASPIYRNVAGVDGLPTTVNGCETMYEVFQRSVEKYGDRRCLGRRTKLEDGKPGPFEWLTYKETQARCLEVVGALGALGFNPRDKLGVCSVNCMEYMLTIRSVEMLSGAVVPMYDSLGESAVEYIVGHAGVNAVLVEDGKLPVLGAIARPASKSVRFVVTLPVGRAPAGGPEAVASARAALEEAGIRVLSWDAFLAAGSAAGGAGSAAGGAGSAAPRVQPPTPDDVVTIMYTSGTTGTPKGVVHTQRSVTATVAGIVALVKQLGIRITPDDCVLSYLTLAHIFERLVEEFVLSAGGHVGFFRGEVSGLMDDVGVLRPTFFPAVPRILERVTDAVEKRIAGASAPARALFWSAFRLKQFLLRRGLPQWAAGAGADAIAFRRVRAALGGRVRIIVSGGAALAPHVEDFCNVALAPLLQGYGLTETCAASFISSPDPRLAYSVGPPLAAVELRLESVPELKYDARADPPRGEVCVRGPILFQGYYRDPKKTEEEMDADGFFHTGDIGQLTPQGALRIIDRKKNIFKLAQGEYIAVEYLEGQYSKSPAVEQIWVHGLPHESVLVAVVVPSKAWGAAHPDDAQAARDMLAELAARGKAAKLKGFEMIKAVHIEREEWTTDNDLMTQSLKLKRPQLKDKYEGVVEQLYKDLKAKK